MITEAVIYLNPTRYYGVGDRRVDIRFRDLFISISPDFNFKVDYNCSISPSIRRNWTITFYQISAILKTGNNHQNPIMDSAEIETGPVKTLPNFLLHTIRKEVY